MNSLQTGFLRGQAPPGTTTTVTGTDRSTERCGQDPSQTRGHKERCDAGVSLSSLTAISELMGSGTRVSPVLIASSCRHGQVTAALGVYLLIWIRNKDIPPHYQGRACRELRTLNDVNDSILSLSLHY